jgi:hypothetical protein
MNGGERWRWSIYGTVVLIVLSASVLVTDEVAYPFPLVQLLLHWVFPYSFLLAFPVVYGITVWRLWPRPSFGPVVLYAVLVVGALNIAYFLWVLLGWDTVQYEGAAFVGASATIVGIGVALVLAVAGVGKRRRRFSAAAYLLLFSVLARCAFPLVGSADI